MPDGQFHHNMWKAGALVAVPAGIVSVVLVDWRFGLGLLGGYGLGRWIDPDLDQVSISSSEGRMMNDFKILGYVLVGYWTVYGAIFRRHHRSFLTHFPVVSTAIRLAYLCWWLFFVYRWLDWSFTVGHALSWFGILIGLSIADGLHYVADVLYSEKENLAISNIKSRIKDYNSVNKRKK